MHRSALESIDRALRNPWLSRIRNLWFVWGLLALGYGFVVHAADRVGPGSLALLSGFALIFLIALGGAVRRWFTQPRSASTAPALQELLQPAQAPLPSPDIVSGEVAAFRRGADGSREPNDLQVVYARVRNARDGGGEPATLANAETWMEAFDEDGNRVGSCQGNWMTLRAGIPDPAPLKSVTLRPTGEEFALEISGKFLWGQDAWLAGETHPSLKPGTYKVRASVSDGVRKAEVFEWHVTNQGVGKGLVIDGALPREPSPPIMGAGATGAGSPSAVSSDVAMPPRAIPRSPARALNQLTGDNQAEQASRAMSLLVASDALTEQVLLVGRNRKKSGIPFSGTGPLAEVRAWNESVVKLAEATLSGRELLAVDEISAFETALGSVATSAERLLDVIDSNKKTLRLILRRTRGSQ